MHRPNSHAAPDRSAILTKAVASAASRLAIRNRQLALIIGTSEASVSRMSSGRLIAADSKEAELALLFLRMFRSLDALVGGDEAKARAWLEA